MRANRTYSICKLSMALVVAVCSLMAAEHHGVVKSGGLPVPGATVTVTQADKKAVTSTDERGVYSFPDLADGVWTIEIEMLGFKKIRSEVAVGTSIMPPPFELALLPAGGMAERKTEAATRAVPAKPDAAQQRQAQRAATPAPNARPWMNGRNGNGYQRLDVNAASMGSVSGSNGLGSDLNLADLSQSAEDSMLVTGSLSRGLDMPMHNDWFGPGGFMPGPPGAGPMGGPGGEPPAGGAAPSLAGPAGAMAMGGPGRGGMMGGPMGGGPMGGPGGGPGGFGGPGGPGGPGGFGGPGMRGGRPDWQGRRNTMAFGNNRRNPRMRYRGALSFDLDNSVWDAKSYSVTGAQTEKPAYANARANIMLGGPLKIPKLLSGEKGMFTFNYQLTRSRNGTTQFGTVPTDLERAGDFSQSSSQTAAVVYDPLSGTPFPSNAVPASRLDTTALALLKFYPKANLPGTRNNYQAPLVGTNNSDNINARVNQTITKKDRLSGGIGYQGGNSVTPNLFGFTGTGENRGLNTNVAWSRTIRTTLINNLRYTFSRMRNTTTPYFAGRENVAAELGIAGTSQESRNWGPPDLSFTNYTGLSTSNAALNRNQTSSVGNSLLWIHGSHSITLGADYRRQQMNRISDTNARGTFTFTGSITATSGAGGWDLADFLLGRPYASSIRYGNGDLYFRSSAFGANVSDDWRVNARLTLNFGVRYDYTTPTTELYDRMVNLDIAPGYTAISQVLPDQSGPYSGSFTRSLVDPDRNNLSPRVGLAWKPFAKHSTVIRSGYGVYYNTQVYASIASNMAQQPPFSQTLQIATSAANVLTLRDGFTASPSQSITNTYAIDPRYQIGYAQTWNFSIQQNLPASLVAVATYLGTKGTRLDQQFLPNSTPPGTTTVSAYPSGYTYEQSNGNSVYHGATFQLMRRFRSGLGGRVSYTYSKSIDDAGTGGRAVVAQDYLNLATERALSNFDQRHNFSLNWHYSSGMGMRGGAMMQGWKAKLLRDWTFMNTLTLRSGTPLTATAGGTRSVTGGTGVSGSVRADATGLPIDATSTSPYFNTAAFTQPAAGSWGDAGRNTIPGPTTFSLNASLGRNFEVGERRNIELRMEATNLLNHVTITSFGTTVGSSIFGVANSAAAMRKMTASVRFRF